MINDIDEKIEDNVQSKQEVEDIKGKFKLLSMLDLDTNASSRNILQDTLLDILDYIKGIEESTWVNNVKVDVNSWTNDEWNKLKEGIKGLEDQISNTEVEITKKAAKTLIAKLLIYKKHSISLKYKAIKSISLSQERAEIAEYISNAFQDHLNFIHVTGDYDNYIDEDCRNPYYMVMTDRGNQKSKIKIEITPITTDEGLVKNKLNITFNESNRFIADEYKRCMRGDIETMKADLNMTCMYTINNMH